MFQTSLLVSQILYSQYLSKSTKIHNYILGYLFNVLGQFESFWANETTLSVESFLATWGITERQKWSKTAKNLAKMDQSGPGSPKIYAFVFPGIFVVVSTCVFVFVFSGVFVFVFHERS